MPFVTTAWAGPLTTVWSGGLHCLQTVSSGTGGVFAPTYSLFVGHWGGWAPASTCYPPVAAAAATSVYIGAPYYFSPGVCPLGWATACEYTGHAGVPGTVTASVCCPSGFGCVDGWPVVCVSTARGQAFNVRVVSNTALLAAARTITPASGDGIWVNAIPVMWESTDTEVRRLFGEHIDQPTTSSRPAGLTTSLAPAPTSSSRPVPVTATSDLQSSSSDSSRSSTDTGQSSPLSARPSFGPGPADAMTTANSPSSSATITSSSILTAGCDSPLWTILDLSTAASAIDLIGCGWDRTACCPFPVAPSPTASPGLPFPTPPRDGPGVTPLVQCPADYQTVSSGCCPSGFHPTSLSPTTVPSPVLICATPLPTPLSPPTTTPNSKPTVYITASLYAAFLPLTSSTISPSPSSTTLPPGAWAGIAVGAALVVLALVGAGFWAVRRHYRRKLLGMGGGEGGGGVVKTGEVEEGGPGRLVWRGAELEGGEWRREMEG